MHFWSENAQIGGDWSDHIVIVTSPLPMYLPLEQGVLASLTLERESSNALSQESQVGAR